MTGWQQFCHKENVNIDCCFDHVCTKCIKCGRSKMSH